MEIFLWALMKSFSTTAEDYNFMWVNVYKDIDSAVSESANWWNNSGEVLGIKPSIIYDAIDGQADKRYFYMLRQQINSDQQGDFVIFNFAKSKNINNVLASNKKHVIPGFTKNMKSSGMRGWVAATKITPQGSEYASFMTYDAFDSMSNLMKHLSGDRNAAKGIDWTKTEPVVFDSRYLMEIISSTSN